MAYASKEHRLAYGRNKYAKDRKKVYGQSLSKYSGMSIKRYTAMFTEQRGLCAVCQKPETRKMNGRRMRLCVDHDHITGKIRRLLCNRCNRVLGEVNDSILLLTAFVTYLKVQGE